MGAWKKTGAGRGAEGGVMEGAASDGVGTGGSDRVALEQSPLCTEGMNPVSRASMDPALVCCIPTMCFVPGDKEEPD